MINPIHHRYIFKLKGIYSLETSHVESIFFGVRAPLMMGIDPTNRAEIMFLGLRVKLIKGKFFAPFQDSNPVQSHRCSDRPSHPAKRTVTASWINQAILKVKLILYGAAVARCIVNLVDNHFSIPKNKLAGLPDLRRTGPEVSVYVILTFLRKVDTELSLV